MQTNIVVSNIRIPKDEWINLKSAASSHDMSVNEYIRYMSRVMNIKTITAAKKVKPSKDPYQALKDLVDFASTVKREPMGINEDDKIIYGID